jgi:hypothetical protein
MLRKCWFTFLCSLIAATVIAAEPGLVGHWPLQGDCRDHSGRGNHGVNHGVDLASGAFDGVKTYVEVPSSESLKLGTSDFTIAARVYTAEQVNDVIGDVLELYDPDARRGITLSIHASAGGFQSQGTDRHVYFGIDNAQTSEWQDCGRPNEASNYVSESMTVYKGNLYAATTGGKEEKDWRRVYRYAGGQQWIDCGQVGDSQAQGVGPLIVHNGDLYAVTWTVDWTRVSKGGYDAGRVYKYLGGTEWEDCGQVSENRTLNCIASYRGKLYVGGGPEKYGVFVQDGPASWKPSKLFEMKGPRRCFPHSMAVFNDRLFTGYPVAYAFDGNEWKYVGQPFDYDNDGLQLYCFAAHQGRLCVGSWPESEVAVYEGGEQWREIGRVGEDGTEVNGLVVYNGKLYGGSLPRAEVCRYDGGTTWTSLKKFYSPEGWKPGLPYQATRAEVNEWVRLTSLTVFDGKLFASTGSCTSSVDDAPIDVRGKVFSMEAGKSATYDDDIGPGWKHIVAIREGGRLKLFVDGKLVAQSSEFDGDDYNLSTDRPLRIGFGQSDYFAGKIQDVRIYNRAMSEEEVGELGAGAPRPVAQRSPAARIVVGPKASRIDEFAAKELQGYLKESLDWQASIDGEMDADFDGPTFFVGALESGIADVKEAPELSDELVKSLGSEGVAIRGDGDKVALVGKGKQGGLFAVYEFLEKFVGCRWPEPGREHVPRLKSLDLNIDRTHSPAFAYRGVALHGPCTDEHYLNIIDWLAKNRSNSLQFSCEVYDEVRPRLIESILDRGVSMKIGGHSRKYFFPSEKYFGSHPEYYALVKGKRTGETQMCYSNHESVDQYAANINEYLASRPEIGVIGLWPSDGYGFCECDECQAKPTTDVLLEYTNALAKRIHDRHPGVHVEFLSYIHYTTPPASVVPLPYVIPIYCEYWSRNQFHPITAELEENAKCRDQLKQWAKLAPQMTVYGYYADDTMKRFLYNAVPDVVLADLNYYKSIGVDGSSVLMMCPQSWWSNGPHMYAYAQGSWDAASTVEKSNDEYFRSLYGESAGAMAAHQAAARRLFDTTFGHGETGEEMLFNFRVKKFDPTKEESSKRDFAGAVAVMRNNLAEAKTASGDPWILGRIDILDENAQLMEIIYNVLNEAAGFKVDKQASRKDRVHQLMKRFHENQVVKEDDYRCKILKSLMPQVIAVLGESEAAAYDRVPVVPVE